MKELWAIFADDVGTPVFTPVKIDDRMRAGKSADEAFDEALKARLLYERPVGCMWVIDQSTRPAVASRFYPRHLWNPELVPIADGLTQFYDGPG